MNNYQKAFYYQKKTSYPFKLCEYLQNRFCLNKGKFLDVGCGNEDHMKAFKKFGFDVWGIDNIKHKNKKIKVCDLTKDVLPFENKTFDVVFTKSCLEHLKPVENSLKEIKRVLKRKGILIVLVPDWRSQYKSYYDGYDHVTPFTKRGLRDLMNYIGFKNVTCEYFYQLPFVWNSDIAKVVPKIISVLPDRFKWRDEYNHRKLVRFSKEKMILGVGYV